MKHSRLQNIYDQITNPKKLKALPDDALSNMGRTIDNRRMSNKESQKTWDKVFKCGDIIYGEIKRRHEIKNAEEQIKDAARIASRKEVMLLGKHTFCSEEVVALDGPDRTTIQYYIKERVAFQERYETLEKCILSVIGHIEQENEKLTSELKEYRELQKAVSTVQCFFGQCFFGQGVLGFNPFSGNFCGRKHGRIY